ncbi:MAG TPA: S8 family serine peptidase [Gemmatimonadaceae bacterium]|nr:S8 family serine peptidase [Gemmatimonadaceae bacterium]
MTRTLTTESAALAGCTGRGIRIAIIDSGAAGDHPHVGGMAPGVALVGDDPADTADRLGHGTAVAAAIREKAPGAVLVPVRVLDRTLATSARILAQAIDWSAANGVHLVNLSLGTTNEAHIPIFAEALARASSRGVLVVSARAHAGATWYPGSLPGALGIVADEAVPRFALRLTGEALGAPRATVAASPYPRPIPGVPPERNLSGVSFAVANATGLLALALEAGAPTGDPSALVEWLGRQALHAGDQTG